MIVMPTIGQLRILGVVSLAALCGACTVGPDYVRPVTAVPPAYKEATAAQQRPSAQVVPAAAHWWTIYHDPRLDALVAKVALHNQSLKVAAANMREARALLDAARGPLVPSVTIGTVKVGRRNENDFGVGVSWEPDLWGRIRRGIQAHSAATQASADDLDAALLSMQAQVVQSYFALREKDAMIGLLQQAAGADKRAQQVARNQYAAGVVARADVAKAQARLASTQVQLAETRIARAELEHAIAVMLGRPPADFSIAVAPFDTVVPQIPAGLPSTLLQRRPDIAAAERRVAEASARIGVRIAQTYPSITLVAGIGILKGLFGTADVKAPIYTGGALTAQVTHARAAYDAAVADYRKTVLNAFREVEDSLVAQNALARIAATQAAAVASTDEAQRVTENQYQAGVVGYGAVVEAQAAAVQSGQAGLGLRLKRLDASVKLVKALGGGWHAATSSARAVVQHPPDSPSASNGSGR